MNLVFGKNAPHGAIVALTPNPVSPDLLAAYREAEYVVRDPPIVLRIGERNGELDALLGESGGAAFLTAANPGSERLSDEENARRSAALREMLDAAGTAYREGEGRDPRHAWPPEPSLLVLGIARAEAIRLARGLGQNAFVWCEAGRAPELVLAAKWRLVLDTQVWLDWLAFDDPSAAPLKLAVAEQRAEIYMDAACEAELERVLGYPIAKRVPEPALQAVRLAGARRIAKRPARGLDEAQRASLPRCRDRDDQKFLELAAAAQAHALVTKDRALLELARRTPFRIVVPADLELV